MRYFVNIDGEEQIVDVAAVPGGGYDVRLLEQGADPETGEAPRDTESTKLEADVVARDGLLTLTLGGRVFDLVVDGNLPDLDVHAHGHRATVKVESTRMRAAASVRQSGGASGAGVVVSPMPGKVVKVLVEEGQEVAAGDPVAVVEAMKMENELVAEAAGTVKKVFVSTGDAVESNAKLVTIG